MYQNWFLCPQTLGVLEIFHYFSLLWKVFIIIRKKRSPKLLGNQNSCSTSIRFRVFGFFRDTSRKIRLPRFSLNDIFHNQQLLMIFGKPKASPWNSTSDHHMNTAVYSNSLLPQPNTRCRSEDARLPHEVTSRSHWLRKRLLDVQTCFNCSVYRAILASFVDKFRQMIYSNDLFEIPVGSVRYAGVLAMEAFRESISWTPTAPLCHVAELNFNQET